jgi:hypothetical protein
MPIFDPTSTVSLAVQEAKLLHPGLGQRTEYFALGHKPTEGDWYQTFHPLCDIEKVVQKEVDENPGNLYLSQASFGKQSRLSINASSIRSVFVDLDNYDIEHRSEAGIEAFVQVILNAIHRT